MKWMTLNLSMVQLYLPSQKILQLWSSFIARSLSLGAVISCLLMKILSPPSSWTTGKNTTCIDN